MHFLRQAISIVAVILLPVFLFLFGFLFSLYHVFGSPTSIKEAVKQSGAYDSVIQDSLNSIPTEEGEEQREGVPLDDPAVQQIFDQAVSAEFLEEQATEFLDSIYAWIRGEESKLQFSLDLSGAKTDLIDGLAAYANERAGTLPDCTTPEEIRELEALDVFSISCIPPGFDRAAAADQVKNELGSLEFLEDPVITASDLADEGKTPEQQLEGLKNAYNVLLASVYVTGIGSIVLIAAAWLLSPQWRIGLRRVGVVMLVVGSVSTLVALAGAFIITNVASGLAEGRVQATFADIIGMLAADVRNWWVGYGIVLIVLGLAALIGLRLLKPATAKNQATPGSAPAKPPKSGSKAALNRAAAKTRR